MKSSFQDSLECLTRLSAGKLDQTSRRIRKSLAEAEWKMSLCLLAMVRSGGFRELGYATITEYGERALNLSGKKLAWLLGAARALEHLPLLSEAFKEGRIGWGKVRALQTLATPETEAEWLEYALNHSTAEVGKKVALSPKGWKRQRALEASLRKEPVASREAVSAVLRAPVQTDRTGEPEADKTDEALTDSAPEEREPRVGRSLELGNTEPKVQTSRGAEKILDEKRVQTRSESRIEAAATRHPASLPLPQAATKPAKIRVVVELTPDQYALYEAAETRMRAQAGARLSRAEVVTRMAECVLDQGTARARARHQVLIHTCESCREAWYETSQGVHPVGEDVLEKAHRDSVPMRMDSLVDVGDSRPEMPGSTDPGEHDSQPAAYRAPTGNPPGDFEPDKSLAVEPLGDFGEEESLDLGGGTTDRKTASDRPLADKDPVSGKPAAGKPVGETPAADKPGTGRPTTATSAADSPASGKPANSRAHIPNATLRALYARAGKCCERCGRRGVPLDVHHKKPICEGGGHSLDELRLYCRACHTLHHQKDHDEKPAWRRAKNKALMRSDGTAGRTAGGPGRYSMPET